MLSFSEIREIFLEFGFVVVGGNFNRPDYPVSCEVKFLRGGSFEIPRSFSAEQLRAEILARYGAKNETPDN